MSTFEKLAAGQPSFSTAVQQLSWEYAFPLGENEPTAFKATGRFWQYANAYTRPAPNSPLAFPSPQNVANTVTAYFDDDTSFHSLPGGLLEFDRTYATVPASWDEDSQYAFAFPAYVGSTTLSNVSNTITAISANTAVTPWRFTLSTTATGIAPGDQVYVDVNYSTVAYSNVHSSGFFPVVAVASGSSVTITGFYTQSTSFGSVSGTIRLATAASSRANPATFAVDARVQHDYALTDGTIANVTGLLPTIPAFKPILATGTSAGSETSVLGTGTLPTAATYGSMVAAGTEIVAETSTRRDYAGNIRERTTIFIKAK